VTIVCVRRSAGSRARSPGRSSLKIASTQPSSRPSSVIVFLSQSRPCSETIVS
jgi:hypothetical protein